MKKEIITLSKVDMINIRLALKFYDNYAVDGKKIKYTLLKIEKEMDKHKLFKPSYYFAEIEGDY